MSNGLFFVQDCPTCGRRLHIRVEYLGREVVCQHCRGRLTACDPATCRSKEPDRAAELLRRADELLRAAPQCESRSRLVRPR